MSDAEPTLPTDGPHADRLGVVEPLRIPGAEQAREAWRRLPRLGRLFVALAVIDFLVRALGLAGLSLFFDLSSPLVVLLFVVPHAALILLPAVLLWRRADALEATPLIVWGAIAVALVELLSEPLFTVGIPGTASDLTGWAMGQVVITFARTGGYLAIAMGLLALATSEPGPVLRGLANLVAGVIAGAAVTSVLLGILLPPTDFGVPGMAGLTLLVGVVGELATIGFAGLAWAILRGTVDARRPVEATYLAFAAILLSATNSFLTLGVNLVALGQIGVGTPATVSGGFGLGFLGTGLVLTLLVVAFGLGLADTSVRIPRRGSHSPIAPEPEPDRPSWPAPGGEVPAFRLPERLVEAAGSKPARDPKRSLRRSSNEKESQG